MTIEYKKKLLLGHANIPVLFGSSSKKCGPIMVPESGKITTTAIINFGGEKKKSQKKNIEMYICEPTYIFRQHTGDACSFSSSVLDIFGDKRSKEDTNHGMITGIS